MTPFAMQNFSTQTQNVADSVARHKQFCYQPKKGISDFIFCFDYLLVFFGYFSKYNLVTLYKSSFSTVLFSHFQAPFFKRELQIG